MGAVFRCEYCSCGMVVLTVSGVVLAVGMVVLTVDEFLLTGIGCF